MPILSLRVKTLLFAATMWLLLAVGGNLWLRHRLMSDVMASERAAVTDDATRAARLVADLNGQLERLVRDWARWDDTYAYVVDRNETYRRSNLEANNFHDLGVDVALLLGLNGQVIYGDWAGAGGQPLPTAPQELLALTRPGQPLARPQHARGLVATARGVLLTAGWPVVRTDGSGPPRGMLVFGRYLDAAELSRLSGLAGVQLDVSRPDPVPTRAGDQVPGGAPVRVVPLSENTVTGLLPLEDITGKPSLALRVTSRRGTYHRGQQSIAAFSRALVSLVAISCLLLLLGLERLLLRRVARASTALAQVAATGDTTARVPADGADELGRLIEGINDALASIEAGVARQQDAAREVEHLRQLADTVINHTPLALFVKEAESGRYVIFNRAAEELSGLSAQQVIGRTDHDIHPPAQADLFRHRDREAIERGALLDTPVERIVVRGGVTRLVHTRKVPLVPTPGEPAYIVAILEDITEQRAQQRQLQHSLEELARSNVELEQFAYVASHDLQEPLRMVASYVQLLARRYAGQLDERADQYIGFAVDGATRMQGLINDLLSYSRVGTAGKEFAAVSLEDVLEAAVRNLQVSVAESGAKITHDALPTVSGGEAQLVQLLQNLLGNAIKFHGDEAPAVHAGVTDEGTHWRICVADNGIGIEPQYLERIFVIFQRLHGRGRYPGTGIGLAICRRIVERHGGRIFAASEPGQGSQFTFTLPKAREAQS